MRRWFLVLLIVVASGGIFAWQQGYIGTTRGGGETTYRMAKITRGDILMAVSTTGRVTPVITVDVGSQISGQISEMLADFNTPVQVGQIIARLDPASFVTRVDAANAELAVARTGIAIQMAAIEELKADADGADAALRDANQELQRIVALYDKKVAAQSNVDRALSARDQARARLDAITARRKKQRAQLQNAKAQVLVKKATLKERKLDLDRTVIRAPIDGVVTGRNVDLGQTVAASLQAPVLFTIAGDLARMQLEVSVDEADIGRVLEGQVVNFTVDAHPQRKLTGKVLQIRKAPVITASVVTYVVIVGADNPDQILLPGMTANVNIVVGQRTEILRVPESALRFRPKGVKRAARGGGGSGGAAQGARKRANAMIKSLGKSLTLNKEQISSVGGMFRDTGMAIRALREGGMTQDQMPDAVKNLRLQASRRIAVLLTPDQAKKYRLILAEAAASDRRRVQVWTRGEDGKPVSVTLVVGLSDGTDAEIIRGKINEGTDVITGLVLVKK